MNLGQWRIEDSDEGIPLVYGDGRYPHDPPRVASRLEAAMAEEIERLLAVARDAASMRPHD